MSPRHKKVSASSGDIADDLANLIQKINGMEILRIQKQASRTLTTVARPWSLLQLERLSRYPAFLLQAGAADPKLPPHRPPSLQLSAMRHAMRCQGLRAESMTPWFAHLSADAPFACLQCFPLMPRMNANKQFFRLTDLRSPHLQHGRSSGRGTPINTSAGVESIRCCSSKTRRSSSNFVSLISPTRSPP